MASRKSAKVWTLLGTGALAFAAAFGMFLHPGKAPNLRNPKNMPVLVAPAYVSGPEHQSRTIEYDQEVIQKGDMHFQYTPAKRCLQCHDLENLSVKASDELIRTQAKLLKLFDSKVFHDDIQHAIIGFQAHPIDQEKYTFGKKPLGPVFQKEDLNTFAETTTHGIRFHLPAFAHPGLRAHTLAHELVHFLTARPDHFLREPWANIGALLVEGAEKLKANGHPASMIYYLGGLQRAVVLGNNPKNPNRIETVQFKQDLTSAIEKVSQYIQPQDMDALRELTREAMTLYQRDDPYWDAAAWKFQNPFIVLDALIAKRMVEKGDPYVTPGSHAEEKERVIRALTEASKKPQIKMDYTALFSLNYQRADPRNQMHAQNPNLPRKILDGLYYGALFDYFYSRNTEGSIALRKNAISKAELRRVLRLKVEILKTHRDFLRSSSQIVLKTSAGEQRMPLFGRQKDRFMQTQQSLARKSAQLRLLER